MLAALTALVLAACSGGDDDTIAVSPPAGTAPMAPQSGQPSLLFYGHMNYQKLASLTNVRVFDPSSPASVLVGSDDIMAASASRPQPSTTVVGYDPRDNSYADLYVNSLYYVADGMPKRVDMRLTGSTRQAMPHSSATGLTEPVYDEVRYLGSWRFLRAKGPDGKPVLVCPNADGTVSAVPFENKTLLTVSFSKFGELQDGVVVYDSAANKFQKMEPPKAACAACGVEGVEARYTDFQGPAMTAGSRYKFLGDLGATATSALVIDGVPHVLDKAALTITPLPVTAADPALDKTISTSETGLTLNGDSAWFLRKDAGGVATLHRLDFTTGALTQVTGDHGGAGTTPVKILSFTDGWVYYGTDGLLLAAPKSGERATPRLLSENTKTSGIRYPFNFGIGADYLYVTYELDRVTGKTLYKACVSDAQGRQQCRDNSFWAGVTAARHGKLNFSSSYPYTPYAYVRVDATDNFGGGTIKTVDPARPMDDGFATGVVSGYNFNTFLHSNYYLASTVDTDGYVVMYGKRDDNFVGDAFLVNLHKADSVVNLTRDAVPSSEKLNSGALHCHGRYCAVCHNFAGGKLYGDKAGTVAASGYNIKLEFADGTSELARLGKGQGENFSMLYSKIKGDFTPVVVTDNTGVEIKRGQRLGHAGLSQSNCNYCHARPSEDPRYGAPGVLSIAR